MAEVTESIELVALEIDDIDYSTEVDPASDYETSHSLDALIINAPTYLTNLKSTEPLYVWSHTINNITKPARIMGKDITSIYRVESIKQDGPFPLVLNAIFDIDTGYDTEVDVGYSYEAASTGGIDSYTVLMLHMDGADGSTTFVDSSPTAYADFSHGGTVAELDTAQYAFGSASLKLNQGYVNLGESGGDRDIFNFGSDDFTIDFRLRWNTAVPMSGYEALLSYYRDGGNYWRLFYYNDVQHIFFQSTSNSCTVYYPWVPVGDTWYHVALVRSGNSFSIYIDGTSLGAAVVCAGDIYFDDTSSPPVYFSIGSFASGGGLRFNNGWVDELRISKGIARWTGNFTPPERAYLRALILSALQPTLSVPTTLVELIP
jgi:hypothetical protein